MYIEAFKHAYMTHYSFSIRLVKIINDNINNQTKGEDPFEPVTCYDIADTIDSVLLKYKLKHFFVYRSGTWVFIKAFGQYEIKEQVTKANQS